MHSYVRSCQRNQVGVQAMLVNVKNAGTCFQIKICTPQHVVYCPFAPLIDTRPPMKTHILAYTHEAPADLHRPSDRSSLSCRSLSNPDASFWRLFLRLLEIVLEAGQLWPLCRGSALEQRERGRRPVGWRSALGQELPHDVAARIEAAAHARLRRGRVWRARLGLSRRVKSREVERRAETAQRIRARVRVVRSLAFHRGLGRISLLCLLLNLSLADLRADLRSLDVLGDVAPVERDRVRALVHHGRHHAAEPSIRIKIDLHSVAHGKRRKASLRAHDTRCRCRGCSSGRTTQRRVRMMPAGERCRCLSTT
eukprot:6184460-Pleurochrysis_carterae.AAC.5